MSEAIPDLGALGVDAVGISPDPPDRQKRFDDKQGLGFPLLSDPDRAVARAWGALGKKTMFGVTKEGIIRSSFVVGEDGKILGAWYRVKPQDTVPRALAVLEGCEAVG